MSIEMESNYLVQGYRFVDEAEAENAKSEVKKIAYIEEHMDYKNLKMVYNFYNNCIENNIFTTPIGYAYLEKTREFIISSGYQMDVQAIPVASNNQMAKRGLKNDKKRIEKLEEEKKRTSSQMRMSVLINIVLLLLVIGMFLIANTSSNPNILNYEKALVDKYASWDEELSIREDIIREKELELSILNEE